MLFAFRIAERKARGEIRCEVGTRERVDIAGFVTRMGEEFVLVSVY